MGLLRALDLGILLVWIFLDGMIVFPRGRGHGPTRTSDRRSTLAIILATCSGIGLALLLAKGGAGHFGRLTLPVQIGGLAILAGGISVRSVAIAQLGRFHMPVVAVQSGHRLVDRGLYRYVRHPSYLGASIAFLGFGLGLGSWLSAGAIVVLTTVGYLYRIHVEEQALVAGLGDAYTAYRARTWRLVPWIY